MDEIILPTLRAMSAMGAPYKGVLFAGLMITQGRPEADRIQCALRRSGNAGADAAADVGSRAGLAGVARRHAEDFRSALVSRRRAHRGDGGEGLSRQLRKRLASSTGSTTPRSIDGVEIFHAGTKADGARILANGGRVLNVCAIGKSVAEAQSQGLCCHRPRSTGRTASAAATSGGCAIERGRAALSIDALQSSSAMSDLADLFPGYRIALDRHLGRQDVRALRRRRPAAPAAARLRADQCDVAQGGAGARETLHARAARPARLWLVGTRRNPATATRPTTSARWRM